LKSERPSPRFGIGLVGEHHARRLGDLARRVEDLGFDDLWLADERFYRDVYASMAWAASTTQRVRIGTCVTDPYSRHPALTAAAIATVDEMAGGRAILGMGAGASGFSSLGIDRTRPAVALREAIQVIRALWRGERVDFRGEVVRLQGGKLDFPARQDIPIVVAGRGPRILEVGGEVADGVIIGTFASERGIRYAQERIRRGADRAGRDAANVETTSWLYVSISQDRGAARELVKRGIAVAVWGSKPILDELGIEVPSELRELMERSHYSLAPEVIEQARRLIPDDLVDHMAIAGTAEDVARRIVDILSLGVGNIAVWPFPPRGTDVETMIEPFAREVIPRVRAALTAVPGPYPAHHAPGAQGSGYP
jgi:5,10-methylenetetrahydromethanopterin reductase